MKETEFFREFNRNERRTILDSILINNVTEDNIIESINNRYVKIFKFIDINFCMQEMNRKREFLDQYKRILNVVDTNVGLSIIIRNRRCDLSNNVLFDVDDNIYVELKEAANITIKNNVDKNDNTYVVDKYFVFEIEAQSIDEARSTFSMLENVFNDEIEVLEGAKLYEIKRDNIYKFLSIFYNKNLRENNPNYKKNISEEMRENLGISFKELIAPTNFIINDNEMMVSDKIYRNFYFKSNYRVLDVSALNNVVHNEFELITCIKIKKLNLDVAIREAELELAHADGDIYGLEVELSRQGLSKELLPRNLHK